jgi:hypothetical protein
MRPPLRGCLAIAPVSLLVFVPFVSAGRAGTLGVSVDNDMAFHLRWAEAYRSPEFAQILHLSPGYPLGPHALVAAVAQGFDIGVDMAFAGLTAALPVLLGLTALAALPAGTRWAGQALVATAVGLPFLIAGFYAQGSFKELMQAMFVLAVVLELRRAGESTARLRWVPLAVVTCGTLSVYSFPGLVWPIAIVAVWMGGLALAARWHGRRGSLMALRGELAALAIALALALVALVPQLPRLARFFADNVAVNGTGIEVQSLGNLKAPLPLWEAFGVWDNPDYRLPAVHALTTGMWTALAIAVVLGGGVWCVRRGEWLLVAGAGVCFCSWAVAVRTQSPYVAAKALVILAPLAGLVALRPLVERPRWRPRALALAPAVLAVVLVAKMADSSWVALRSASVGPRDHLRELRRLRPLLGREPTLFVGSDDFIRWELAGVPVSELVTSRPRVPIRPEKGWTYGHPFDFDSVDADVLNSYTWVIAPRDAAGSSAPPELRLVRQTASYGLWRRTRPVEARSVLPEGSGPAVRLDCAKPEGRAIRDLGGRAAVRPALVTVPVTSPIAPGSLARLSVRLGAGSWDIVMPYTSATALEISAPGLRARLPPVADRPGARWPVGRIRVERASNVVFRIQPQRARFTPDSAVAKVNTLIAVPAVGEHVVPLRRACGELVDWYQPSSR